MKNIPAIIAVIMLSAHSILAAPVVNAVHKDRSHLPITVKSNELTTDNKGKLAVFTGKVVAKQGDVTIHADKLTINYGSTEGDVEKIEADGNVRIIQENRTGIAAHAVYENREGRIVLTGSPRVTQGADTISGKIITYFIDEERSIVSGGGDSRVEAVIHPPARKGNDAPR